MTGPCDLLLLNANTNTAMTERMVAAAGALHPRVRGATVSTGVAYISDETAAARAARATEAFARALDPAEHPDVLVIACFGDPGLWALRALLPVPVIGMAEASCHAAAQIARRFAIVTGGHAWGPILERFVADTGLGGRLSGVHTLDLTGDRIAADPAAARGAITREIDAATTAGAEAVILGGAGLIGLADALRRTTAVPLLDSLSCAVLQAAALGALVTPPPGAAGTGGREGPP